MKNSEANTFVFIASVIIGILISMNISFTRNASMVFLSSKQYQDAYNYRNKLYRDISSLMEQYDEYYIKLNKYENNEKSENQVKEGILEELEQNKILLGKVPVEGEGIVIDLNDSTSEDMENSLDYQLRLVHNTDVIQVFNDLRNAKAEAISINGHRIIGSSEIYCSGPFLRVNGVKIVAPFTIQVIGNSEVLYNYMMSNENYLKTLMTRKLRVKVEKYNNIKIPAYTGEYRNEFIQGK